MSRLLLYTDISPSRPWLFAEVNANRALLAEHGIELGPSNSWACERVPSQIQCWMVLEEDAPIPQQQRADMQTVAACLDAGRDVLLMGYSLNLLGHQSLTRLIREYIDLRRHAVQCLYVVGRPACVLEQRYREGSVPEAKGKELAHRCAIVPLLLKEMRRTWGNVTLLADTSGNPAATRQEDLLRGIFAFLSCPVPRPSAHMPRHPLVLASAVARRLCQAAEVRENSWPPMDERLFMDCLCTLDGQWGTEAVSPLALRKTLCGEHASAIAELESMLGVASGAMDCPAWLAEQAVDNGGPLPADKVRAFAAALPPHVQGPLRRRYAYDAHLLTPDQLLLDEALTAVAPDDVTHIGEPVPPVELTVLTMTYAHEKYIADCMDSVLAQRTTFPVRHLVLDHHSPDGTAAIVAAYAERHPSIRPVLLSQRRHPENVMGLFLRARSKYVSLCDGDDYFTHPLKLQRQVDFLESHPHCALCFHPVSVVFENGDPPGIYPPLSGLPRGMHEEYYLADMFQGNLIQTNSVVYRWRFQNGVPDWFRPDLCPGDWYWHLLHAEMGKIGFLPEIMSAYRRHQSALYAMSFISPVEHRRQHGMAELNTYQAVNEHFQERYFRRLSGLANGVFADFFEIYAKEGDDSLLNQACETFPRFAQQFLSVLNLSIKKDTQRTPVKNKGND